MLLRSSSTPVLSSFSDTPNKDFEHNLCNKHTPSSDHNHNKLSFSHSGYLNFSSFACNPSPFSHFPDLDRDSSTVGSRGFRRARSDGNLEGLAAASCDFQEFCTSNMPPRSSRRTSCSMLQTIPSFSIYNSSSSVCEDNEEGEQEEEEEELGQIDGLLERSVTLGENTMAMGGGEFSFGKNMSLIEEEEEKGFSEFRNSGVGEERDPASPPLYVAKGLGIYEGGGFGGNGGGGFTHSDSSHGGRDGYNVEEYYKKMVEENPCSPLFLRNYAQFLYQSKGDLQGAEKYYSRAILADPGDGEILSQYAKLVWELHHDHNRALSYFEQAVQAAPEDSHVLSSYASFLWETEDGEEEDGAPLDLVEVPHFHGAAMASASA
ncbi:hypothetical protein HHK36_012936 [Tetracentron sinense]|uniref:Uncharacterized protein n=1 Tax=Tetracentron sinense TaxID=13715 RepID=A0A834Z9U9_TETSI|nr:hypothetical protein HHK36_012936 [Tetracentron sinense]